MKTAAKRIAGTKKRWHFAIWLILTAFTLQSYVIQTHLHDTTPAAISKAPTNAGDGKSPVDNSPLDCPFCQAALTGAFALSDPALVFLSAAGILLAAPDHPATASYDTVAHIWNSRAPPQQ
jgi:hypothetical protein